MRIRVIQKPPESVYPDDPQIARFEVGFEYEVGWRAGAIMLMEGYAELVQETAQDAPPESRSRPRRLQTNRVQTQAGNGKRARGRTAGASRKKR